jgi:hypothetical protein
MNESLKHHRILFFVGDIYEDMELWYPLYRLQEAGAETVIAGETLEALFVRFAWQGDAMDVVVEVKKRIILPVDFVTFLDDALPKPAKSQKAFAKYLPQSRHRDGLLENQHRRYHHGIFSTFHSQPRSVDRGHLGVFERFGIW